MSVPSSLLIGALLGALHAAAALVVARRARTLGLTQSLNLVIGAMTVRMALMLAAVAAVVAFLPVQRAAFVGALGVVFALGLAAEVALVLGRPASSRPSADV